MEQISHLKILDTLVDFMCLCAMCRYTYTETHVSVRVGIWNVPGRHVCWRLGSQLTMLFWESVETLGGREPGKSRSPGGVPLEGISSLAPPCRSPCFWPAAGEHPCSGTRPAQALLHHRPGTMEPLSHELKPLRAEAQWSCPPVSFLSGVCLTNRTRVVIAVEN